MKSSGYTIANTGILKLKPKKILLLCRSIKFSQVEGIVSETKVYIVQVFLLLIFLTAFAEYSSVIFGMPVYVIIAVPVQNTGIKE